MLQESKTRPFWLLTLTAMMILVVSQLIQDGAFMDGMLYVSVSKNLADGIGTFWDPHFCISYQSSFHEQPPLYFGLLALFYKVFGGSMYVERLFCFCCFLLTGFYIHKLWRKIFFADPAIARNSWLPVLYWTIIPICFWAYTNMVEEVVMSLFVVIAVYHSFIALFLEKRVILNLVLSGIFIFLAFFTKGIQGIFPVIAAGAFWLIRKNYIFKTMLLHSLLLVGIPLLIYFMTVTLSADAHTSFDKYFGNRLVGTFSNRNDTTDTHFFLLGRLITHLLPIAAISFLLRLIFRKYKATVRNERNSDVIKWLLLLGFSGSLPLLITLEQRSFYLVTSMPFFALSIAVWAAPQVSAALSFADAGSKRYKAFALITVLLLAASVGFSALQAGKAKRDAGTLQDVYAFGKLLGHGEIVTVPSRMDYEFSFKEYMIRYFYINTVSAERHYFICKKDTPPEFIPAAYTRYPIETKEFDLYIKK